MSISIIGLGILILMVIGIVPRQKKGLKSIWGDLRHGDVEYSGVFCRVADD